jgi:hypothetical protein
MGDGTSDQDSDPGRRMSLQPLVSSRRSPFWKRVIEAAVVRNCEASGASARAPEWSRFDGLSLNGPVSGARGCVLKAASSPKRVP